MLSIPEIAEYLGISYSAVYSRIKTLSITTNEKLNGHDVYNAFQINQIHKMVKVSYNKPKINLLILEHYLEKGLLEPMEISEDLCVDIKTVKKVIEEYNNEGTITIRSSTI